MKLKSFTPDTTPQHTVGSPAVTATTTGRIGFNVHATNKFDMENNNIVLHQDEEENWYLQITKGIGFKLKFSPNRVGGAIQNTFLSRKMLNGSTEKQHFTIGEPFETGGIQLYPLLKK